MLDSDLPHRLARRHLPGPVWILLSEDGRVGPVSKPNLHRCDPSLSVLEADTSDLHTEHSTPCLAARINLLLCRPSEPDETSNTLNQGVFDLAGYLRLRSSVRGNDIVRKVLGLRHTTDVQQIDRSNRFVNRFLGRRKRLECSNVLLLPLHELEDVLRVELSYLLDVAYELVLCLGERIFKLGDLLEDLLLKRALAQLELI